MDTARTLVIETPKGTRTVHLSRPRTIGEVWYFLVARNRRPTLITMPQGGGIIRVTY